MAKAGFTYIMASKRGGTIYVGSTSNLPQRTGQHKDEVFEGFTSRYKVHTLVWVEPHPDIRDAIARERQLKKWNRAWKIQLIEEQNPEWNDLWDEMS